MAKAIEVLASEKDIRLMNALLAAGHIEHKFAVRLQTVVSRYKGISTNTVASVLSIDLNTVSAHVKRFNAGGVEALLQDKTRKPGTPPIPAAAKDELTRFVCQEKPRDGTHWSTRELSRRFKISHTAVNTILRERNLKPHLVKKFQFSTDKDFIRKGQSHDYYRHGTTTLFAALNVASGKVIGKCSQSHKACDYVGFLKVIDRKTPKEKVLHIIADNNSSHKAPAVKEYLEKKAGRFVEHYTPTYSSWLNMVERWFAEITNKRIRRESWSSLKELEEAITDYITSWNKSGRKFQWTKGADEIQKSIDKVKSNLG